MLYAAAWSLSEGVSTGAEVATAKAYASEACLAVARRAHQIFGAIGYCEEHPPHLLHKRIPAAGLDHSDRAEHPEAVAPAIGLEAHSPLAQRPRARPSPQHDTAAMTA